MARLKSFNKLGIELEFYSDMGYNEMSNIPYITRHFDIESDSSLEATVSGKCFAYELKSNGPKNLANLKQVLKAVTRLANDKQIGAVFIGKGSKRSERITGATGLHIHFGAKEKWLETKNLMDCIRLMKTSHESQAKTEKLGLRSSHWAPTHIDEYENMERAMRECLGKSTPYRLSDCAYTDRLGTNMCGLFLNGDKTTVEMRWASAELAKDINAFTKYTEHCMDMLDTSFTSNKSMTWKNYTLTLNKTNTDDIEYCLCGCGSVNSGNISYLLDVVHTNGRKGQIEYSLAM